MTKKPTAKKAPATTAKKATTTTAKRATATTPKRPSPTSSKSKAAGARTNTDAPAKKPSNQPTANNAPRQRGVSCYVVWLKCTQSGGCPDLAEAFVTTSLREVQGCIENDIDDDMTAMLLVDCRPTYEVRVVRAGTFAQAIDLFPYLTAKLGKRSFKLQDETEALLAEVEDEDFDDEAPPWETILDWSRLSAALPALDAPLAKKGVIQFDDAKLPPALKWGASDPRVSPDIQ